MDLGSMLKVLGRRWLVLLLGALLTLGVAGYVYLQTPSRYQSTARMLLLLPANSRGEAAVGSPFLYLPNGLTVLARIVALTPTSRDFQASMAQEGFRSQYEVGVDNQSPTLTISVEGTDPEDVVATRDRLIQAMNEELLTIQREEDAPPQQIAHTRVYAAESSPAQIGGDRLRGVLAVGAAGALLTLILVFVIDRLSQVRASRRKRTAKPAATVQAETEQTDSSVSDQLPENEDLAIRADDAAHNGEPDEPSDAAGTIEAGQPVEGEDTADAEPQPGTPRAESAVTGEEPVAGGEAELSKAEELASSDAAPATLERASDATAAKV